MKKGVNKNRDADKKSFQRNVSPEERERRMKDYMKVQNEMKMLVVERKKFIAAQ